MKNTWKGLIVGALTGMMGGAALDAASRAGRSALDLVGAAKARVPVAGHEVAETGTATARKVKGAVDQAVAALQD